MEHWFRPMGLSLRVSTNSAKLSAAVCEAYGVFGVGDAGGDTDLRFDFMQSSAGFGASIGLPEHRMSADRAELRMREKIVLSIEPDRGEARGCFPEEFVDDHACFRLHALHFALCAALPARGFLGVHAACIVIDGRAVLLRGAHGAGKSVLAYAAALRGFPVVSGSTVWFASDDMAWWGISRWIYLRSSARALFSEMPTGPEVWIAGERKIEIDVAERPIGGAAPGIVVLLDRDLRQASRLEPISKPEALRLWDSGSAGNETSRPDYRPRIARLLDRPVYRLNCADDLDHALDLIAAAVQDCARC
jgi:hypothetical protein